MLDRSLLQPESFNYSTSHDNESGYARHPLIPGGLHNEMITVDRTARQRELLNQPCQRQSTSRFPNIDDTQTQRQNSSPEPTRLFHGTSRLNVLQPQRQQLTPPFNLSQSPQLYLQQLQVPLVSCADTIRYIQIQC